jgi:hypothetical protein
MAAKYYLTKRSIQDDHHSIHREGCPFMPDAEKRIPLGHFLSGDDALAESWKLFKHVNCCRFCIPEYFKEVKVPGLSEIEIISIIPTEKQLSQPCSESASCFLN